MAERELVLLTHGLLGARWMMLPLARRLAAAGFEARRWGYRSVGTRGEALAAALADELRRALDDPRWSRVHIVGHSLGSILARRALQLLEPDLREHRFGHLFGRLVQLAPPNGGSFVARRVGSLFRPVVPLIAQLSDDEASWVCGIAPPEGVEVGVIAAARDAVVAPDASRLPDVPYIVCPGRHGLLPLRRDVAHQTSTFLARGAFDPEPSETPELPTPA